MPPRPFEHQDADRKPDEVLRTEARAHLGATPHLQLVAELLGRLRALDLPWWTPEMLRERWSATERMRWYRARPDLRQKITTSLTGLAPRAARKKAADFQGALLDAVIDEGDVAARAFENAYDPGDLVTYGPVESFWHAFIEKMPWGQDTPVHQELIAWLFDALLADHGAVDGVNRKPILSAWDARTAIDGRVWHTKMPLEIRVAIDEARFKKQRERSSEPFHAESDLSIAVAATITSSLPLRDLLPVFAAAERAMGFSPAPKPGPQLDPKRSDEAAAASRSMPPAAPGSPVAGPPSAAPAALSSATPMASQPRPSAPPPPAAGLMGPPVSGPRAVSTPPPALAQPAIGAQPAVASLPAVVVQQRPREASPASDPVGSGSVRPPASVAAAAASSTTATPTARPVVAANPAAAAPLPADRPSSVGPRADFPADRPTAPSARYDTAPANAAAARTEGAARAAAAAAILAGMPAARGSAATLLDALADIPGEEERTNPWDIPSDDASVDNDDTGVMGSTRRDATTSSGKRKRHGKG
jgi:hypothetical protein